MTNYLELRVLSQSFRMNEQSRLLGLPYIGTGLCAVRIRVASAWTTRLNCSLGRINKLKGNILPLPGNFRRTGTYQEIALNAWKPISLPEASQLKSGQNPLHQSLTQSHDARIIRKDWVDFSMSFQAESRLYQPDTLMISEWNEVLKKHGVQRVVNGKACGTQGKMQIPGCPRVQRRTPVS